MKKITSVDWQKVAGDPADAERGTFAAEVDGGIIYRHVSAPSKGSPQPWRAESMVFVPSPKAVPDSAK